jgi:hypothetical protein
MTSAFQSNIRNRPVIYLNHPELLQHNTLAYEVPQIGIPEKPEE